MDIELDFMFQQYWNEKWKDCGIVFSSLQKRYLVSNYGRIGVVKKGQQEVNLQKPYNVNGYHVLNVRQDKYGTTMFYIHKLVANCYLEKGLSGQIYVIHKNYNKTNNYVENLAWATASERGAHQKHNPDFVKVKHKAKYHKIEGEKLELLKRRISDPKRKTKLRLIAKQFGISESHLYRIKKGLR